MRSGIDVYGSFQERLVTSMESGGFALPGKEKGRLAKLSFQSGEHKKAHGLFAVSHTSLQ